MGRISACQSECNYNVDVGYMMWELIDRISSDSSEMSKRYSFIYVDQNEEGNNIGNDTAKIVFIEHCI